MYRPVAPENRKTKAWTEAETIRLLLVVMQADNPELNMKGWDGIVARANATGGTKYTKASVKQQFAKVRDAHLATFTPATMGAEDKPGFIEIPAAAANAVANTVAKSASKRKRAAPRGAIDNEDNEANGNDAAGAGPEGGPKRARSSNARAPVRASVRAPEQEDDA
ncbi:Uu.00g036290.m01.CDS01 [Anthostomella pinea]|uniref:Uu.00g036290.m01.CDS01 n=1 Tax=Anthostomella pinea TaxID=933095 RepID=A0AAI8YDG1_9PEZI|nr:Uu.00g036290.m01.CDS01 [Anthostomella pinea]